MHQNNTTMHQKEFISKKGHKKSWNRPEFICQSNYDCLYFIRLSTSCQPNQKSGL